MEQADDRFGHLLPAEWTIELATLQSPDLALHVSHRLRFAECRSCGFPGSPS